MGESKTYGIVNKERDLPEGTVVEGFRTVYVEDEDLGDGQDISRTGELLYQNVVGPDGNGTVYVYGWIDDPPAGHFTRGKVETVEVENVDESDYDELKNFLDSLGKAKNDDRIGFMD